MVNKVDYNSLSGMQKVLQNFVF